MNTSFALRQRQSLGRTPTAWENELADAIEGAFASGVSALEGLVAALNASRVRTPDGEEWTPARFEVVIRELSAP